MHDCEKIDFNKAKTGRLGNPGQFEHHGVGKMLLGIEPFNTPQTKLFELLNKSNNVDKQYAKNPLEKVVAG